jgi:spermidine dehydrogenase
VKKDFMTWRYGSKAYHGPEDFEQWLDGMSYKNYLEAVMGLGPEVTAFVDPVLACSTGFGADVVSAFGAYQVAMPGFQGFPRGFSRRAVFEENKWHSFPGGNDGFSRHFVKWLIPDAISGGRDFGSIMNGRLRPDALDLPGSNVRIRPGCLAANVEHGRGQGDASEALVTYVQDGKARRVRAGSVVMACGSLVSRRIVRDMPSEYADAFSGFTHAPVMVANVAIRNWRFLYKLGLTACRWFGGFGFSCNVRRPMIAGDYTPPLDPDRPAVLSFYIPFYYPGLSAREQGEKGRREMLATPYAGYEKRLLDQMTLLFGSAGFDAGKDVAGIILNRWGHAFTAAVPGFYFGRGGKPSPRSVIRKKFGRVAFAHSELNGHQHWLAAVEEGTRAAKQLAGFWT